MKVFLPDKSHKYPYIVIFNFNIICIWDLFVAKKPKKKHVSIHFLKALSSKLKIGRPQLHSASILFRSVFSNYSHTVTNYMPIRGFRIK